MRQTFVINKGGNVSRETLLEFGKDTIPFEKYVDVGVVYKIQTAWMRKNNIKPPQYINLVCAFDIETTTIKDTHEGFMYIWQFCIGEDVIIGRTWEEFLSFIKQLIEYYDVCLEKRLVIYVHNLQFEFQFLKDFFNWEDVFAVKKRVVLKALTDSGVEFRCSYKLSNMSLEKMCINTRNCKHIKQVGDFDYNVFRTPKTYLSNQELSYCYCDVKGLVECIEEYLEEDTLATIPMTSTSFIRRECREAVYSNYTNRLKFLDMRMNSTIYKMLKEALRGGNTHGSYYHCEQIVENVKNFDVASSYPYVQTCKYFPMTAFKLCPLTSPGRFEKMLKEKCCLFHLFIPKLRIKRGVPIPYLSFSKLLHSENVDKFNGRVLYGEMVYLTVTEIDYEIILKQYDILPLEREVNGDIKTYEMAVSDLYTAKRGKLPKELRDYIKYRFKLKTELKKGDKYLYMKSKNKLNGIFGMSCTDCVHDGYILHDGKWEVEKHDIDESLKKFYESWNSFMTYAWGIYTTAHARAHLQRIIDITGINTLYVDTDSDKCYEPPIDKINTLNAEIREEVEREGAYCDFDGKRYYMGVFEEEEPYKRFKTLGAKKYAYEDMNGELHITIAGVSKSGAKELEKLENFKHGFTFKKAGGSKVWYNDDKIHYLDIKGEKILTASNVGMEDREYTIGLTETILENLGLNSLLMLDEFNEE